MDDFIVEESPKRNDGGGSGGYGKELSGEQYEETNFVVGRNITGKNWSVEETTKG